jgi:hypothetical protein
VRKELKRLSNKADKLWKTVGKEGRKCEVCESSDMYYRCSSLQAHHFITRSNKKLRWDLRNRVWLCPSHHTLGTISAHKAPAWFRDWFGKNRTKDYRYLERVKNEKAYSIDYEKIIKSLEAK